MTVRVPVRRTPSGDIRDMTQAEINALIVRAAYIYGANPAITISIDQANNPPVPSPISTGITHTHNYNPSPYGSHAANQYFKDQYWVDGEGVTNVSNYPTEGTTPEPYETTDAQMRVAINTPSVGFPTDASGYRYFLYRNASNHLQAMSGDDLQDTIIIPALEYIAGKSAIAGAPAPEDMPGIGFKIVTTTGTKTWSDSEAGTIDVLPSSPTASGHIYAVGTQDGALTTGYQVHQDQVADQTRYTDGTGEANITTGTRLGYIEFTTYWLMRKPDQALTSAPGFADSGNAKPLMYDGSGNLREMTLAYDAAIPSEMIYDTMMQIPMKWYAVNGGVGKRLRYEIADAATTTYEILGSIMIDRNIIFDSIGAQGTVYNRFVNADDYRSAEFPIGSPTTQSQYALIVRHDY
tara:strand:+ start:299 stop:1519 length:1221 start_codon:yes stop_codon:yes gene_type:complete